jgi:trypsin
MKRLLFFILALVVACEGLQAQGGPQRITGGFSINITDAPWQVLIEIGGSYACGGSIIAPNFILTAKHCVSDVSASSVKVIAGVTCKTEVNSGNTFNVSRIIRHPDPNIDVALLQLSSNITYNNKRTAINYWTALDNALYNVGNTVRASGWGWLTPGGFDPANCLQAVDVSIISNQDATNILVPLGLDALQAYEMATTGVGTVRQGACHGDSGGPLIIRTATNEPVLVGVVSWGRPNCPGNNVNSPSIYVRVSSIVLWIATNLTTISGPSDICAGSSAIFTVSNAPEGFTWESSSNLTKISSGGNTADFLVTGYSDYEWVNVNLNGIGIARHYVDVPFEPPVVEIAGPDIISEIGSYSAVLSSTSTATQYDWSIYNSSAQVNGNGYSYIYVSYSGIVPTSFVLLLTATNACAEGSATKSIYATGYGSSYVSSYVSSYPNPVSDILQIEIDQQAIARAEALRQTTTDGKSLKIDPTYDIRLYDGQGNLLRRTATKGGKVEFNVANLATGIYYLHIYDGTGNKPEVRQIVVQH